METQDIVMGEKTWKFTLGVLEYDAQCLGKMETSHRRYLERDARFLRAVKFENSHIESTIRITPNIDWPSLGGEDQDVE